MIRISIILLIFMFSGSLFSQDQLIGSITGHKIPRFVSLKSNDINLRVGSSINYPIIIKYITTNMPIEITGEYLNWRKVKDIENNIGWIHQSLIQGDRYAIINKNKSLIYNQPNGMAVGEIQKNNIAKLNKCLLKWCQISIENKSLWIKKDQIWGVYKNEIFNIPFYQKIINNYWSINMYFKKIIINYLNH